MATIALTQQSHNSLNPLTNLPDELQFNCLFASGTPSVFATCKALNKHQKNVYFSYYILYQQQHFIKQFSPNIFETNLTKLVPKIYQTVKRVISETPINCLVNTITPLGQHQVACVYEDWSLLIFFQELTQHIPRAKDFFNPKPIDFHVRMQGGSELKRIQNMHQKAQKVAKWMESHPNQLSTLTRLIIIKKEYSMLIPITDTSTGKTHFICGSIINQILIPKQIKHLTALTELHLTGLNLEKIPEEIQFLFHLKKVNFSHNKLKDLPSGFALLRTEAVDLSGNAFKTCPKELCSSKNMRYLNLSDNCLHQVPEIENLKSLQFLDLSKNKFDKFPSVLFFLGALRMLDLSENYITKIPRSISIFTQLEGLEVTDNTLRDLPSKALASLAQNHRLRYLGLNSRDLKLLLPSVCKYLQSESIIFSNLIRSISIPNYFVQDIF